MLSDNWGTPDKIFNLVHKITGNCSFYDPCPSVGQSDCKSINGIDIFRDHRGDGLIVDWHEYNFVNPPFSNIQRWINKAWNEYVSHERKSIVVIPDHLDRSWYVRDVQRMLYSVCGSEVRLVSIGRQRFIPLDGQKESSPRFGSCLLCFGFDVQLLVNYLAES